MRATRRERYSPLSGRKTTLHCWDGIGSESLEGILAEDWKSDKTFRGRDICKEPERYIPIRMTRVISPIVSYGI